MFLSHKNGLFLYLLTAACSGREVNEVAPRANLSVSSVVL